MTIHRRSWLSVFALGILLTAVSWIAVYANRARTKAVPKRARAASQPIPVRFELVKQETVDLVVGATVITEPSQSASIWVGPGIGLRDTSVRVKSVHVVEGQSVRKGQLLFELESDLFRQAVKQHEMALAAATAERDAVRQLRMEHAATGLRLRKAELNVELAQLELQVARRDFQRCLVRSPLDGFVDVVAAVLGEEVDTSRQFTQVHKLDPIHFRMDFPQERLDDLSLGQTASIVLDSFPHETFTACVVRIAPQADPETRVLPVVLEMGNTNHRIRAGLTGFARLQVKRTTLTVPKNAVVQRGTQAIVLRVENGKATPRHVTLGPPTDVGRLEIRSGLEVGDEIVIYGHEFLQDGDTIDGDWKNWARRN